MEITGAHNRQEVERYPDTPKISPVDILSYLQSLKDRAADATLEATDDRDIANSCESLHPDHQRALADTLRNTRNLTVQKQILTSLQPNYDGEILDSVLHLIKNSSSRNVRVAAILSLKESFQLEAYQHIAPICKSDQKTSEEKNAALQVMLSAPLSDRKSEEYAHFAIYHTKEWISEETYVQAIRCFLEVAKYSRLKTFAQESIQAASGKKHTPKFDQLCFREMYYIPRLDIAVALIQKERLVRGKWSGGVVDYLRTIQTISRYLLAGKGIRPRTAFLLHGCSDRNISPRVRTIALRALAVYLGEKKEKRVNSTKLTPRAA